MRTWSHTRGWRRIAALLTVVGLAACASPSGAAGNATASPNAVQPLQAVIVSSWSTASACGNVACLVAGKAQRIGFFIVDPSGDEQAGVEASARLVEVRSGGGPSPVGEARPATYHGDHLQVAGLNRGVYSVHFDLPHLGTYALQVKASKGTTTATSTASFIVLPADPGIPVGSPAPRSDNETCSGSTCPNIDTIDTGVPPDDMHYTSIASALARHRPMLIYMGTPGFCQSRTCGPEVRVVQALEATYRSRGIDFIHVETYRGGRPDASQTLSTTFKEWKLDTEPWIVVVDRSGNVSAKFAGATGADEVAPELDRLLG